MGGFFCLFFKDYIIKYQGSFYKISKWKKPKRLPEIFPELLKFFGVALLWHPCVHR